MSTTPAEVRLRIAPQGRFDTVDVRARLDDEAQGALEGRRKALYTSFHTTAGYLDRGLAARLAHHEERLRAFVKAFRAVFPQHAPYRHDQMELRQELSAGPEAGGAPKRRLPPDLHRRGHAQLRDLRQRAQGPRLLHRARRGERVGAARAHHERRGLRRGEGGGPRAPPGAGVEAPHRLRQPGRPAPGPGGEGQRPPGRDAASRRGGSTSPLPPKSATPASPSTSTRPCSCSTTWPRC